MTVASAPATTSARSALSRVRRSTVHDGSGGMRVSQSASGAARSPASNARRGALSRLLPTHPRRSLARLTRRQNSMRSIDSEVFA
jgi:hypothetical protein